MQFNGPQSHILFVGNLWGPCRTAKFASRIRSFTFLTAVTEKSSKISSTRNAACRTKKKISKAMKRAYHIPKNTGQAARKKCRKAIYAKEKFAEFKD